MMPASRSGVAVLEAEFGELPLKLLVFAVELGVAASVQFVEAVYHVVHGGLDIVDARHGLILSGDGRADARPVDP